MKEWSFDEAVNVIETILMEEIPEEAMTDEACHKLALKIAKQLEDS